MKIKTRRLRNQLLAAFATVVVAMMVYNTRAASVWTGANNTLNWGDANNWNPVGVPPGPSTMEFNGGAGTATVPGGSTVLMNTAYGNVANILTLSNSAGFTISIPGSYYNYAPTINVNDAFPYVIESSTSTSSGGYSWKNGLSTFNIAAGGTLAFINNFVVSGYSSATVTKTGNGIVDFSGFTRREGGAVSGLTIQGGTVVASTYMNIGTVSVQTGGTLRGNATINGAVTAQAGSTLAPGTPSAIGTLTLGSTLTLNATSTNVMRINKTGATVTADKVSMSAASGSIAYLGTLKVVANPGSDAFAAGDKFTLFAKGASGSLTGSFAATSLPALGTDLAWDLSGLTVDGSILVYSTAVASAPTFTPPAGSYVAAQSVAINCATLGATVHYTTDGSTPTSSSAVYSTPITVPVDATTTLKAFAVKSGLGDSAVASATYVTESLAIWTNNVVIGSWANGLNWTNNIVAQGRNGTADLSTLTMTGNAVITLDMSPTIGNLVFGDVGGFYNWTVNPGGPAGTLTLDATSTPVINVVNQTTTIAAPVAGANGLIKSGAGTLALSGANPLLGGITVSAGKLYAASISAVGNNPITLGDANTGTNDIVIQGVNGGVSPSFGTNTLTVAAAGTGTVTIDLGPKNANAGNNFILNRATTVQSDADASGGAYMGSWAGGNTLTGNGALTLVCSAGGKLYPTANGPGFSGPVTLAASSWVAPGTTNYPLGTGPVTMQDGSRLDLTVFGPSIQVTDLSDAGATGTTVSLGGNTLTVNSAAGSSFGGTMTGTGGKLTKTGAGAFVLGGSHSYTGITTVNNGVLELNANLGGPVTVNSGGTLRGTGMTPGLVTVNGTLAPGASLAPGILYIYNTVILGSESTNRFRISKDGGVVVTDQVSGWSGTLSYGGTLVVTNVTSDATALALYDTFQLFSGSGTYSGNFQRFILPALPAGLSWDVSQLTVNGSITVANGAAIPTFNPPAGGYIGAQTVTISTVTPGATLYYTTDGTTPTASSPSGLSPVTITVPVNTSVTIQAFARASGFGDSLVASAAYVTESEAVWLAPYGGSWSLAGNWTNNIVANSPNGTADFSALSLSGDATVTLDGAWTIGHLLFGDMAGTYNWIVDAGYGGGLLTLDATNSPTVTVKNQAVTINAELAGTKGLTKAGPGVLTLGGVNSFTGGMTISAGTVLTPGETSLGPVTGNTILGDANTGTNAITLSTSAATYPSYLTQGTITVANHGTGPVILEETVVNACFKANIVLNRPTTFQASQTNGGVYFGMYDNSTIVSGNVGTLTVQATSTGRAYMVGTNTFVGTVSLPLGAVYAFNETAFGNGNPVVMSGTASLGLYGAPLAIGDLTGAASNSINTSAGGNNLLTISSANFATFAGVISGGGGVAKAGTGTQTLAGVNTYTGATTVSNGVLNITGQLTGSSAVTVNDGATLKVTGHGATPAIASPGALTLGACTLGLDTLSDTNVAPITVGNLAVNATVHVNISGSVPPGEYPLIKYTGVLSGAGSFALGTLPEGVIATLVPNPSNQSLDLNVAGAPVPVLSPTWSGGVLTLNWTTGVLQGAPEVTGTYTNVPSATSPYIVPLTAPRGFFRLSN